MLRATFCALLRASVPVLALATLATGCAVDDDAGRAELTLTGTSQTTGLTYRLRNATLTVAGRGGTLEFRTEDDLRRREIPFRVRAGSYELTVSPGWYLERVNRDGSTQEVDAYLTSPSPLPFRIYPGGFTPIVLSFRVDGDIIDMGDGDGAITIDIDDNPYPDARPPIDAPFQVDAGVDALADATVDGGSPELIVSPPSLVITEGSRAPFSVMLTAPPFETLRVMVVGGPGVVVDPPALVFTPRDYFLPHPVVVMAPEDPDTSNLDTLVTLFPEGGVAPTRVAVAIVDNDRLGLTLSPSSLTLAEGGTGAVAVALTAAPSGQTTITVDSPGPFLRIFPNVLTFDADSWNRPQAVNVVAGRDDDDLANAYAVDFRGDGFSAQLRVLVPER